MGHRDIKATMIYADYSPSEREREWVEAAFARPDGADSLPAVGTRFLSLGLPWASVDISPEAAWAAIGALFGIAVAEGIRWLRKPRAEFLGFDHSTQIEQSGSLDWIGNVGSSGIARFHKGKFKVRGDLTGPAAIALAWRHQATYAK